MPVSIAFSSTGVKENAKDDSVVGKFATVDPDINQTHCYTLLDYNCKFITKDTLKYSRTKISCSQVLSLRNSRYVLVTFYIKESELLLNDSDRLDYEKQTQIPIHVRTTDNGSPPMSRQVQWNNTN